MDNLRRCTLCKRHCTVDRTGKKTGFCGADTRIKIARSALHMWEEPPISGTNGSGTVFFSHCTMKCVYCQNYSISTEHNGYYISADELADEFLKLQEMKAHNINLVTPTHFVPQIIRAIDSAKRNGLNIPIVYNTGGYDSVETIKALNGYIDIYMPDMKYYNDKYAIKYSNAPNYFETAKSAIEEMFKQVGKNDFFDNGIMKKGVIVRHMLLPGLLADSKKVTDYLYKTYGNDIFISIMSQYTPNGRLSQFPEIDRKIDTRAYNSLIDYCERLGMENVYIQDGESASESFIPDFYNTKNQG